MIRVLAIDDEPLALQQLTAYIKKVTFLELVNACQSAMDAAKVMENEVIDAIFVDINMPDLNGMDFVKSLMVPPLVVFTTAYSEYALEGYKVDAVDYLLKPFGLQEFQRAAMKVKSRYEERQLATLQMDGGRKNETLSEQIDDTLFLKTDYKVVRVNVSDIRYVEGMSEYVKIFLEGQKPIVVFLSMKKLEERLPSSSFMRIHRSYIVNLAKITEVNKNRVIMDPNTYLPIGENYKETFNSYLDSKFLGKK